MTEDPNSFQTREGRFKELVRQRIASGEIADFEELAQKLFHCQFSANLPYQRYCRSLNRTPDHIRSWKEIPAVPTSAFKLPQFPLIGAQAPTKVFRTSGTTTEVRGVHHFPDTELYECSLLRAWQLQEFPKLPHLYLAPSAEEAPESSLSHMFATLGSSAQDPFLMKRDRFHLAALYQQIAQDQPVFLLGTALAFLHLMKTIGPLPLPQGSRLLETGGYKGTRHLLAKSEFYRQLADFFDLPDQSLHNEYSMTELSSQAYATGAEGTHRFPNWCRPVILDPETSKEVPAGQIGYLQIHDLANVHSVAAIRTQDFAIGHPDHSFTLIGRDPGALPRGCSRSIDHSLSS